MAAPAGGGNVRGKSAQWGAGLLLLAACLFSSIGPTASQSDALSWEDQAKECTGYNFTQKLDHFDQSNTQTFQQLYYVCTATWPEDPAVQAASGTVIVFQGGEEPVGQLNEALITENAARYQALIIMVEVRTSGAMLAQPGG